MIEKDGINYDELDGFNPSYISYEIDSTTLSQFTGLTDMNGNKILENDIVLLDDELYVIGWDNNDACFRLYYDGFSESFSNVRGSDCEVYGNMFDNRELLFFKIDLDELNLYKMAFDLLLKDDCKAAPGNWSGSLDELYEGRKTYYIDLAHKELNKGE